jgi:hypothetical protein
LQVEQEEFLSFESILGFFLSSAGRLSAFDFLFSGGGGGDDIFFCRLLAALVNGWAWPLN